MAPPKKFFIAHKPRIRLAGSLAGMRQWVCSLVDAKGRTWEGYGATPEAAYRALEWKIDWLDRIGLRWEVFP